VDASMTEKKILALDVERGIPEAARKAGRYLEH